VRGDNLVFVVGPPRSGTTWVLKLLSEHPDVVAATADNLGMPSRGESMETGVFVAGLSSNDIRARFKALSQANPGKMIVEKTPVHLLHVDRIVDTFPSAKLVLVQRSGIDTVASILAVGRSKDAWWKDAPWQADAACRLWNRYYEASLKCRVEHEPLMVQYEDLRVDPLYHTTRLLNLLGLDAFLVRAIVDKCEGGRNIPIKGVFRKGKVGAYRDVMSDEDVATFREICG